MKKLWNLTVKAVAALPKLALKAFRRIAPNVLPGKEKAIAATAVTAVIWAIGKLGLKLPDTYLATIDTVVTGIVVHEIENLEQPAG